MPPTGNVTLQDIADRCGVTKVTVSRALRGHRHEVSEATIERVRLVAKELGYDASSQHVARRLAMRKTGEETLNHLIAIFFPAYLLAEPYYRQIITGVMESLKAERFGLLMNYSNNTAETDEILPLFGRGDVDGAIVLANTRHFTPVLRKLRELRGFGERPVVSIIDIMEDCASVVADDTAGTTMIAQHLLDLGHRHILHFFDSKDLPTMTGPRRIAGLSAAYRKAGLDPAVYLHETRFDGDHPDRARKQLLTALQAHPEITAVVGANDSCSATIHTFLTEAGHRVPQDYSLVGFDDVIEVYDDRHLNILTTVRVPLVEIGRQAARQVIHAARERRPPRSTTVLPVELIIRGTTGPARATR